PHADMAPLIGATQPAVEPNATSATALSTGGAVGGCFFSWAVACAERSRLAVSASVSFFSIFRASYWSVVDQRHFMLRAGLLIRSGNLPLTLPPCCNAEYVALVA